MHTILMDKAARLVETEILANQTSLVWTCLTKGIFSYDEITNDLAYINKKGEIVEGNELEQARQLEDFEDNHEEIPKEIFSWYLMNDWFADYLEEYGEPILRNEHGVWWGRTSFGQMICDDIIIQKIAEEIYGEG